MNVTRSAAKRRFKFQVRLLFALPATSLTFVIGGVGLADQPSLELLPVEIGVVRRQEVAPSTWIPGSIMSIKDARLASVVAGRVLTVADVGERIAAGARVAQLDDTVSKLRLRDLESQVVRTRAQQDLLRITLQRFQKLASTAVLPASQFDEAKAQLDMATADIARLTAQLGQARYESDQSELRAPFSGMVAERFVQQGEYVQIGAPVVRLVDIDKKEARGTASLILAGNIKVGQALSVRSQGAEHRGVVRAVVPIGDERSHQFEIRVSLQNTDWPVGTAVELDVPTNLQRLALTAPRDALVIRSGHTYVMRVNADDTVEQIEVVVSDPLVDPVEINGYLHPGDRLVVRGAERIANGAHVTVIRQTATLHP
jgi:RND family efflux transporter MFP subunit